MGISLQNSITPCSMPPLHRNHLVLRPLKPPRRASRSVNVDLPQLWVSQPAGQAASSVLSGTMYQTTVNTLSGSALSSCYNSFACPLISSFSIIWTTSSLPWFYTSCVYNFVCCLRAQWSLSSINILTIWSNFIPSPQFGSSFATFRPAHTYNGSIRPLSFVAPASPSFNYSPGSNSPSPTSKVPHWKVCFI